MQTQHVKITLINLCLIFSIFIPFLFKGDINDGFVRFGPSNTLHILWLTVNTWTKYICTQIFLAIFSMFQTYREEIIYPWITNNLYDHKQKNISDYSKREVYIIVNGNFLADSMYYLIAIWLSISQIDFALMKIIVCGIMNAYTMHHKYIKHKIFIDNTNPLQTILIE